MAGSLPRWTDDGSRGVSDLVAFVLTFSIIITSVAAVSVGGLGSLEDFRDDSRVESAEVAMTGFDDSMEDIRVRGVPQRSHELSLNGDQLERHSSTVNVTVDGTSYYVPVGAFVRETGHDTAIIYEGGTVYRSQERGQVVVREPAIRCGSDTAHVGLVSVRGDVNVSSNTLTLRARENGSTAVYPELTAGETGSATTVKVNVTGTHNPEAWDQLFRDNAEWSATGASNEFECTGINRAYVHKTTVDLDAIN